MLIKLLVLILAIAIKSPTVQAATNNYIMPVIPLRAPSYWREGADLTHLYLIKDLATQSALPVTWLVHYDVLKDPHLLTILKSLPPNHEIGLFLEVTQKLAQDSKVFFDWQNGPWSSPHKLYLQGYSPAQRRQLIDTFAKAYNSALGKAPTSYGAWYIDGYSSRYLKDRYQLGIQLGLADQYSTDGYQVWGQHLNQPYYQSDYSVIEPSKDPNNQVLKVLWAPREPTLSYGPDVNYSNFSLQTNDYYRSKGLPHSYFLKTLKTLTLDTVSSVSGIVIGLEVGEVKKSYLSELKNQFDSIKTLSTQSATKALTLSQFETQYRTQFTLTPNTFTISTPSASSSYWFQTPYYRIGLFIEDDNLILKDLRFYHQSQYKDNDQYYKDPNQNLSRVVPGLIDQISLHNSFVLERDTYPPTIMSNNPHLFIIKFKNTTFTFTDSQITISPPVPIDTSFTSLPFTKTTDSLILSAPQKSPTKIPFCDTPYGHYQGDHPCIQALIQHLFSLLPALLYTKLESTHFVGLKTGPETLFALTFPNLTLKTYTFDTQILSSFINLTAKLTPTFSWYGRQEDELPKDTKALLKTFQTYGQEYLLDTLQKPKLFENGYYYIPKP